MDRILHRKVREIPDRKRNIVEPPKTNTVMSEENIAHFGWYLNNHKEEEEEIIYSCCGDEMTIDLIDYGICQTCKEHCI